MISQSHAHPGRGFEFAVRDFLHTKNRAGFSLIELLVVISIIGVLSTIVFASLGGARKRARDSRRIADISQLKLALELYYQANQAYPTVLSALVAPGYIPAIPKDPKSGLDYAYVALQGAATSAAICASHHLGARMEIDTTANSGSPFLDDKDATAGGAYGTGVQDGPVCTGSAWAGNADVAAVSNDFNGDNDGTNLVYDMRP
jgi:prepilin-type N-terminal cleavage/methylation domain-containing protein